MTKKNSILILAAAAVIISSCSLDRKPLNGPSSGTFPASAGEAYAGTLAAYKKIGNMTVSNQYYPYRCQDAASDIITFRVGAANFVQQLNGTLTSEHAVIEKEYKQIFACAGRVHQVLDNIENLRAVCDETTVNAFKAELLCIRAQQYDQGMQFFGGIPFIDHCLTLVDNAYPRNTIKECAERILIDDLKDELLDCLPVQWTPTTYGTTRIGRIAAYTLKARIALNWGYTDIALAAAKKAMDLNEEYGCYALETLDCRGYISHEVGEIDVTNLFGLSGQSSKEWMWAAQRNLAVGELSRSIYYESIRCLQGCSWIGPTQSLVDTYQCLDGLSILESPMFDPANPWLNRDPRLAMTALLPGTRAMGIQYEMDYTVAKVQNYVTGTMIQNMDADPTANKYEYAANNTKGPAGFLCRKYYDLTWNGMIQNQDIDDQNTGLIRLAELILIDAEANIEADGGDLSRARKDINLIRARVGMPDITVSDKAGLRKALRYERKVELADEGFRWFDLRRWCDDGLCYKDGKFREGVTEIAATAVNGTFYAPGYSNKANGAKGYISNAKPIISDSWVVTYDGVSTLDGKAFNLRSVSSNAMSYTSKDRYWPIPKNEMSSNTALVPEDQNPGYEGGAFQN